MRSPMTRSTQRRCWRSGQSSRSSGSCNSLRHSKEDAMAELISRPLVEIAQDLRERRLTSQEVVGAAIARHERFGERLQAYCLWTPDMWCRLLKDDRLTDGN